MERFNVREAFEAELEFDINERPEESVGESVREEAAEGCCKNPARVESTFPSCVKVGLTAWEMTISGFGSAPNKADWLKSAREQQEKKI